MRVGRTSFNAPWLAVLLLVLAGSVATARGALPSEIQCLADAGAATGPKGPSNCSTKGPGLSGAIDAVVSPDSQNVYSTGVSAGEVTAFTRNGDGTVTEIGCYGPNDYNLADDAGHRSACAATAPGVNGALGEALSPDGLWLYVAAVNDDAVTWFSRDPSTGALTWAGCVQDAVFGPRTHEYQARCARVTNLNSARWVAISPDGANVYVANGGHSVSEFSRDQTSGALTPLPDPDSCIKAVTNTRANRRGVNYPSIANCSRTGSALWYNREIVVSPDGLSAYSSDNYGYAIAEFARDPGTGALTEVGCIADVKAPSYMGTCAQTTTNLQWIFSLAVSSDGRYLYAGGQTGQVDVFARDPSTSLLTPVSCVSDPSANVTNRCGQTAVNMRDVVAVKLSPDGSQLWASNFGPINSAQQFGLVSFAVDPAAGSLTPTGCIQDDKQSTNPGCAATVDGLRGTRAVAFSPDGGFMYATASVASTLTVFSGAFTRAP
jgi:6-phosphogluconolactonase (cycloisomerase 2 family)